MLRTCRNISLAIALCFAVFGWANRAGAQLPATFNPTPPADQKSPDSGPVTKSELMDRLGQGLHAAVETGVSMYQKGDHQGCYLVYRGALLTAKPLLINMPDLAQSVQARLDRATGLSQPYDRAIELRKAIDEIRWAMRKSLWDRLGGESGVSAVVQDVLRIAGKDPRVNFTRNNKLQLEGPGVAVLERRIIEFVSSVTGGNLKYAGKDMKAAHAGMKISDDEFNAFAEHVVTALKRYRVPQGDIDELMAVVGSTRKDIVESGAGSSPPTGGGAAGVVTPPPPPPAPPAMKKTLWDRLGGDPAVKAIVHDFVMASAANPKVNFARDGRFKLDGEKLAKLETSIVEFISSATGGPWRYAGRDMKLAHTGMKITEAEFNAMSVDLANALKKYSVPQADIDELMAIVGATKKDIVGQ